MRQKNKRFILMLFMAACFVLLTACSSQNGNSSAYAVDPSLAGSISQVSESLLEEICSFDSEDAQYLEEELRDQRQDVLADGVADWAGVQSDTGSFVRAVTSQVTKEDNDNYICTIYAEFEKRNLEFRIHYTYQYETQGLLPSNISFTPEYTLGEKMQKAFLNMILGMGLVFIILIFLSLVISCFRFIGAAQERFSGNSRIPEGLGGMEVHADTSAVRRTRVPAKKEHEAAENPVEVPVPSDIPELLYEPEAADDLELVAVIAAAIAASENIPADGLRVRSIRRVSGSKWKNS